MENHLFRGRLIDHLHLVVRAIAASKRFYAAALGALGIKLAGEGEDFSSKAAHGRLTGPMHFGLQATSPSAVGGLSRSGDAIG